MGWIRNHPRRLARPEGIEPPTLGLEGRCSIQLSYGRIKGLHDIGDESTPPCADHVLSDVTEMGPKKEARSRR